MSIFSERVLVGAGRGKYALLYTVFFLSVCRRVGRGKYAHLYTVYFLSLCCRVGRGKYAHLYTVICSVCAIRPKWVVEALFVA